MSGILLCGVGVSFGDTPVVIGEIVNVDGVGFERRAIENAHNSLTNNWVEVLLSCLKRPKPVRLGLVFNSNDDSWLDRIDTAKPEDFAISFPIEDGYTTGAVWEMKAGLTDFSAGGGGLEERLVASCMFAVSGEITITKGTPE